MFKEYDHRNLLRQLRAVLKHFKPNSRGMTPVANESSQVVSLAAGNILQSREATFKSDPFNRWSVRYMIKRLMICLTQVIINSCRKSKSFITKIVVGW